MQPPVLDNIHNILLIHCLFLLILLASDSINLFPSSSFLCCFLVHYSHSTELQDLLRPLALDIRPDLSPEIIDSITQSNRWRDVFRINSLS